jgi:hypothetical protein
MGFSRPKAVDSEGEDRFGGGGGGGSSAKAADWVELSIDPNDASWVSLKNGNANNPDCTLTNDGTHMVASMLGTRNYNLGGTTNNGMSLISSAHIQPWANHSSGSPPPGVPDQQVQSEAMVIKFEVQFDDVNGPWNGDAFNGYGQNMICVAGFASYQTDQGGSPGYPGWIYRGAQVRKSLGNEPLTTNAGSLYRAGYKSYFGWSDQQGAAWSNQLNATSNNHDCIVFELGIPLRRNGNTGQNLTPAGSYSTTNPFGAMVMSGYGFNDGSTVYSDTATNGNYFHFWIYFGSHTGSRAGVCKIKRIRYCIQPVASRVAI